MFFYFCLSSFKKTDLLASKVAHLAMVLTAKTKDLNSVLRTHMVELTHLQVSFDFHSTHTVAFTSFKHTHMYYTYI